MIREHDECRLENDEGTYLSCNIAAVVTALDVTGGKFDLGVSSELIMSLVP